MRAVIRSAAVREVMSVGARATARRIREKSHRQPNGAEHAQNQLKSSSRRRRNAVERCRGKGEMLRKDAR